MSILAFAEHRGGTLRQAALETVTAARRVADALGDDVIAVLLGPDGLAKEAERLGRFGADRVLLGKSDAFVEYAPEAFTILLADLIRERGVRAALLPASAQGKDLAPRVAARLGAGLASDVTQIDVKEGRLQAIRPAYAGKVFLRLGFKSEPALISVRSRAYTAEENPREPELEEIPVNVGADVFRTKVRGAAEAKKERPDVAEAEIIVSGGRGLQSPENWKLLEELADALGPGVALGASRAVVDAGWRPHSEQVGQTGKVVAPPLYFAVGISGAIQHLAGMRTAKCIVAVNKDPDAPIFKTADYGIVGDLFEVVPRLTEEIRKLRAGD
ncbi:MAG: electron transfer flavoprotein subunit alpha/FixB family protein [Gemmatimonadota bacterium]|nr:MAG: electron transfer flavoprotein subunit alpha/FixB family protein [Gemmatimonadota bacterium]